MREETRYRVLYFVYFAALSGFGTFRNVYLNSIDLTGFEMGVIGALITVAGTFSQPFWGLLTDWRGAQREVLILTSALAGVAVLSYPLGARFQNPFVLIALGTVVYSVFRAPITPIIDSLALSTEFEYGDVRAFGSVAFGLGAFAYGVLISGLGSSIIFYVYSLGMFLFALLARGIKDEGVETSLSVVEGEAVKLVKDREFFLLLVSSFLVGMTILSGNDFFSVYMRSIGAPDTLTGVAWLITTVVEALAFVYAFRFETRFRNLLVVGALTYAARYSVFAVTQNVGAVLLVHLLTGVSFAAFYLAAVNLANSLSPDSLRSTAQTLLWGSVFGFGAGAGQVLAGSLFDTVGVQAMYASLAGIAVLGALVALLIRSEARGGQPRDTLPGR